MREVQALVACTFATQTRPTRVIDSLEKYPKRSLGLLIALRPFGGRGKITIHTGWQKRTKQRIDITKGVEKTMTRELDGRKGDTWLQRKVSTGRLLPDGQRKRSGGQRERVNGKVIKNG